MEIALKLIINYILKQQLQKVSICMVTWCFEYVLVVNVIIFVLAVPLSEMTEPVKLLDLENGVLIDSCLEYLSDQNDFLVVGVIGYQGVGKSTVLSYLADPNLLNKK